MLEKLMSAIKKNNLKEVEYLIANGADVNAIQGHNYRKLKKFGETALHIAAEKGHTEIVELLLDNYAYVNVADKYRSTALHVAAKGGHKEVVELLLDKGANFNATNKNGKTSLELAAKIKRVDIVELFLIEDIKRILIIKEEKQKNPKEIHHLKGFKYWMIEILKNMDSYKEFDKSTVDTKIINLINKIELLKEGNEKWDSIKEQANNQSLNNNNEITSRTYNLVP